MSTLNGNTHIDGTLTCKAFTPPANCITKTSIPVGAGIEYTKTEHLHRAVYSQPNTAATSETKAIAHVVGATGTLLNFLAGSIAPCSGAATITIDLKKNGSSVLSAVITLDNANTARVAEAGTITTTGVAAGDLLEIVITATAGGGTLGTGLYVVLNWKEDAQ
jgi:hypothetical protein